MNKNGIDAQVCVNGRPIREFGYEGRTLVEGRKGVPFTVKVKNNKPKRVMIVVGVDGVNVISGNNSTTEGYIIEAYSSYEIKGWRQSLDGVASFVFQEKDGSYSKVVKGHSDQCGVISVMAYDEKSRPVKVVEKHIHHDHHHYDPWYPWVPSRPPYDPFRPIWYSTTSAGIGGVDGPSGADGAQGSWDVSYTAKSSTLRSASLSNSAATASTSSENASCYMMNLGAGWGDSIQDTVKEVEFEIGTKICSMDLYYTDEAGLRDLGIDPSKAPAVRSFPAGLGNFCRPPA